MKGNRNAESWFVKKRVNLGMQRENGQKHKTYEVTGKTYFPSVTLVLVVLHITCLGSEE